jgi:hypothetical protein
MLRTGEGEHLGVVYADGRFILQHIDPLLSNDSVNNAGC